MVTSLFFIQVKKARFQFKSSSRKRHPNDPRTHPMRSSKRKRHPKDPQAKLWFFFSNRERGSMNQYMGVFTAAEGRGQGNVVQGNLKIAVALLPMDNSLAS